ncbi:cylicin-1-like, partial [Musca vetustissima]|uniref:cylicin-1-like n=1 Tax=Musca vetustissima TaxID=27455 RepID=UPI002AB655EC
MTDGNNCSSEERKNLERGSKNQKCLTSGEKIDTHNLKANNIFKKDKGNQSQVESKIPKGNLSEDNVEGKKKKKRITNKANLEDTKTEDPTKTTKGIEKSKGKESMEGEDDSRDKGDKKKNKKTKADEGNDFEENQKHKKAKKNIKDVEEDTPNVDKRTKKKSTKNSPDFPTKDLSGNENALKIKNTKSNDKKNRDQEQNLQTKKERRTKSPDKSSSPQNNKKSHKPPKKLMVSNIIKDLRWKVRNGLDIRAHRGSAHSIKIKSHKRKVKALQKRRDKESRFDEKPWDILRAAMEQREQCDLTSK